MDEYGLIGKKLSHSFSKKYFENKFQSEAIQASYELFEIESIEQFPKLLQNKPKLRGLNVTIPYKEQIIGYLDAIDPFAEQIGAVNTITIEHKNNQTICKGYNTDATGFQASLDAVVDKKQQLKALVLGTGGASKTVQFILEKNNIPFRTVSRKALNPKQLTYEHINPELLQQYHLIINCSPVGMYPLIHEAPALPYQSLTEHHILIDLVYNPEETLFLARGKATNSKTINGLLMLYTQAEEAWKIWNK